MSLKEWLDDPNGDGNTEAASENPTKGKRGRPRIMPREWDQMAAGAYGDRHPRTYLKRHYALLAIEALNKTADQDFSYLVGKTFKRWEILTELGQLQDDDEIRETAIAICEHKLKSKEAVTLLRRWRNGKSASGDLTALAEEIAKVIRYYKLRYPDTTDQQVRSALWHVGEEFGEHAEAIAEDDEVCDDELGDKDGSP